MEKQAEIHGSLKNIETRGSQKPCEANQPLSFLHHHVLGQTKDKLNKFGIVGWPIGIIHPPLNNPRPAPEGKVWFGTIHHFDFT